MTGQPDAFELNRNDVIALDYVSLIDHVTIDHGTSLLRFDGDRFQGQTVGGGYGRPRDERLR